MSKRLLTSLRFAALLVVIALGACRERGGDDVPAPAPMTGAVALRFSYVVGDDALPLYLDSAYLTASDDLVRVRHLKYYLSRVRLQRADSSYWTAPDRAFLLDAGRRDSLTLSGVPPGEYVALTFDIGLDSASNSRSDWDGDLAPARLMHWSWNTGYKFLSLEGEWLGAMPSEVVEYHVGRAPTLRTVRLPLPRPATATIAAPAPRIRLAVRPLTVFGGPNVMLLSDSHERNVMFDTPQALRAADNYATMFRVTSVE